MGPKSVGRLLRRWVPLGTTLIHTKKTHCILPQANIVYAHFEMKDQHELFRAKISRLIGVLNQYAVHKSLSAIDVDSTSYSAGSSESESSTNSETSYTLPQDTKPPKVLIFCNSVNSAQTVSSELRLSTLSGGMWWSKGLAEVHKHVAPEARGDVVEQFCYTDITNVIVCTDVLSRGMDLVDVNLIVMFDFPTSSTGFLHRAGRTARAGKNGEVLAFVGPSDVALQREMTREREVNSLEHTFSRNRSLRKKIAKRNEQEKKEKEFRDKWQMSRQMANE